MKFLDKIKRLFSKKKQPPEETSYQRLSATQITTWEYYDTPLYGYGKVEPEDFNLLTDTKED